MAAPSGVGGPAAGPLPGLITVRRGEARAATFESESSFDRHDLAKANGVFVGPAAGVSCC
jgi:hypothetical protein